ncbi:uncharacterized protein PHACADRAFT_262841 [Phanerochaete carnosa HHB-10118-sp]|uniref:Uncharacterized protein n=1 Tax=Phanerochaete carnosa (strain HHB-10118-sp) TaxID=650164 RepID=K5VI53_PHACS|nr:uncharacterized protein PHACADRAFT_262841 [Phanerochaete carnosa HHB-10118-sp]EKM50938.1 hypothetical protein PHACADRAFT_262841 [Phanerochaete carnosa HHB-10118-sp]
MEPRIDGADSTAKVCDMIRGLIACVIERSLKIAFLCEFHPNCPPASTDVGKLRAGDRVELKKLQDTATCCRACGVFAG